MSAQLLNERAGAVARPAGAGPGPARRPAASKDDAPRLLLALARMARNPRDREAALPGRLAALVESGELARRHIVAFAVIGLFGPMTVSELAAHEGLAVSTASLLVTQLADAGMVERREDEHDRRRTVVSVEPAVCAENEELLAATLAPLRRALQRMGAQRARALIEGLDIVAEELAAEPALPCGQRVPPVPSRSGAAR